MSCWRTSKQTKNNTQYRDLIKVDQRSPKASVSEGSTELMQQINDYGEVAFTNHKMRARKESFKVIHSYR